MCVVWGCVTAQKDNYNYNYNYLFLFLFFSFFFFLSAALLRTLPPDPLPQTQTPCPRPPSAGPPKFRAFFPSPASIFACRPPGLHTTTRELQTCTFEGPGFQKHHQNSTRRPPREGRKMWEARSRPGCQGPQRKCAGYLSTTSWKLKLSGSRKEQGDQKEEEVNGDVEEIRSKAHNR